jgi:hypothetical protein
VGDASYPKSSIEVSPIAKFAKFSKFSNLDRFFYITSSGDPNQLLSLAFYPLISMPLNPLSIFYSVPRWELSPAGYIQISWRSDPDALREIARAGKFEITGVSLVNLPEINTYIDRLLVADSQLATVVVAELYRLAAAESNPIGHNCWFNFLTAMTFRAALNTWRSVPKPQQSEELFEQLVTPVLSTQQLFDRFDPGYHVDLLVGLQAWTYRVVAYNSFAYLRRNGNPYFGLSNFGIISRSSWRVIQTALHSNIIPEQIEADTSICKIFKTYLERSRIRVNRLEPQHWQEILAEIKLKSLELTIDELRGRIDRIGGLVRAQASPIIEQYDERYSFTAIDEQDSLNLELKVVNETLLQIFALLDRFMDDLSTEDRKIIQLRHHQKLNQNDIAESIAKDRFSRGEIPPTPVDWCELSQVDIKNLIKKYQPYVCRRLANIYLNILEYIHAKISHPNDRKIEKNSLAIDATKQLLVQYFHHVNISSIT